MVKNCTLCQEPKNIIYWDYGLKTPIRLCYECILFLDWQTELKEILPKLHKCNICRGRYISKKNNPIKCGLCWAKYFNNMPEKQEEKIHIPEQQKVMAYV